MSGEPSREQQVLADAFVNGIGGSRGLIDSSLPTLVFLVGYFVTGRELAPAVWAALAAAVGIAVWRKVRRQPIQQVLGGLAGVVISAVVAARTGAAEDFFLPGLLTNAGYAAAFVISALIGKPLVGYAAGAISGDLTGWARQPDTRRAAMLATWLWAGMFALRLVVQVPLYLAGLVGALGVAKLVLGTPLFLLVVFWSYLLLRPTLPRAAAQDAG